MLEKRFKLMTADGTIYESDQPGILGGNRKLRIYGRLDCGSANANLVRGYAQHRVFFADESTAIAAGYRPCGNCMRSRYRIWREGGVTETIEYPWHALPSQSETEE